MSPRQGGRFAPSPASFLTLTKDYGSCGQMQLAILTESETRQDAEKRLGEEDKQ